MSDDNGSAGAGEGEKKVHGFDVEVVETTTWTYSPPKKRDPNAPDTELRLYKDGKKWQEQRTRRINNKRKEQEKEEMEEVRGPWVTDLAKEMARDDFDQFVTSQQKWAEDQKRKRKGEKMRQDAETEEKNRPEKPSWEMSAGSREIIDRKQQLYSSPSSRRGWRKNLARYLRAKEGADEGRRAAPSFHPRINEASRRMQHPLGEAPVGDRLYRQHAETMEQLSFKREGAHTRRRSSSASAGLRKLREARVPTTSPRAEDFDTGSLEKGTSFEVYEARMRVAELAEALEFEIEKNKSYDRLSREVHKEAEYLTGALRNERERNELLLLEIQHEKSKTDALQQALEHHLSQTNVPRNIGEPLVRPSVMLADSLATSQAHLNAVSLSLSPRRCHPPTAPEAQRPALSLLKTPLLPDTEINLDDL